MAASLDIPRRYKSYRNPYLEKPKTDKFQECGEGNGICYGVATMQGWRTEMEDAHMVKINLGNGFEDWSYFAVFDGHAGAKVARYAAKHLLDTIIATEEFHQDVTKAIHKGFLELDSKIRSSAEVTSRRDQSGSTALCALVSPKSIYIANCGDSRAVLCSHGQPDFWTFDHKPRLFGESDRIHKAGGRILFERVNGSLAVSRALGDFKYKTKKGIGPCEQMVSPEPAIFVRERDDVGDEFLILACDGIWDVMSNDELCAYIRNRLTVTSNLQEITAQVIDTCFYKQSRDNMTIVLVVFPGAPKPTTEAILAERRLDDAIETVISEIIQKNDNSSLEEVLRQLELSKIEGLPPAGLASKRALIEMIYKGLHPEQAGTSRGDNPGGEIVPEKDVNTRPASRNGPLNNMELIEENKKCETKELEQQKFVNKSLKSLSGNSSLNNMYPSKDKKFKESIVVLEDFANTVPKSAARKRPLHSMDPIEKDKMPNKTNELKEFVNKRPKSQNCPELLCNMGPVEEDKIKVGPNEFVEKGSKLKTTGRLSNNMDSFEDDKTDKRTNVELQKCATMRLKSRARKGPLNNMEPTEENKIGLEADKLVNGGSTSPDREGTANSMDPTEEDRGDTHTEVELEQLVNKPLKPQAEEVRLNNVYNIEEDGGVKHTEVESNDFAIKGSKSLARVRPLRPKSRVRKRPSNNVPVNPIEDKKVNRLTEVEPDELGNEEPKSPTRDVPLINKDPNREFDKFNQTDIQLYELAIEGLSDDGKTAKQTEVEPNDFIIEGSKSLARVKPLNNMDNIEDKKAKSTDVEPEKCVRLRLKSRATKRPSNNLPVNTIEDKNVNRLTEVEPDELSNEEPQSPAKDVPLINKNQNGEFDKFNQTDVELEEFVSKRPKLSAMQCLSDYGKTDNQTEAELEMIVSKISKSRAIKRRKSKSLARKSPSNNIDLIEEINSAKQTEVELEHLGRTRSESRARKRILHNLNPIEDDKKVNWLTEVEPDELGNEEPKSPAIYVQLINKGPIRESDRFNETDIELDEFVNESPKVSAMECLSDDGKTDNQTEAELEIIVSKRSKSRAIKRGKSKSSARKSRSNNIDLIEEINTAKQKEIELEHLGRTRSESRARKRILDNLDPIEEDKKVNWLTEVEADELGNEEPKSPAIYVQLINKDPIGESDRFNETVIELDEFVNESPKVSAMECLSDDGKTDNQTEAELEMIVSKRSKSRAIKSSARKSPSNNIDLIEEINTAKQKEIELEHLGRTRSESRARKRILDNLDPIEEDMVNKRVVEPNVLVSKRPKSSARGRLLNDTDPIGDKLEVERENYVDKRPKSRGRKRVLNNIDQIQEGKAVKQIKVEPDEFIKKRPKSRVRQKTLSSIKPTEEDKKVPSVSIGIVGIGNIGGSIVGKLIESGHTVNVWNRTSQRSVALNKALNHNKRLIVHHTAQSLFIHSENIFICISDEIELRIFFQDNFDIDNTEEKTFQDKGIIIMTSMSPDTAKDMSNMIEKKGGRYLEALIQWSSKDNDRFILLTAGDESLFKTIHPYTKAISISAEFLGNAGSACCFYLILQLIKGVCLAGLVEGVHLAERLGFENSDFQSLFETSQLCNNFLKDKMAKITNRQMELSDQRLEDLQTDMKLGLHMSNELQQQLHICTVTHQLFKHSCKLDYGGFDPAAIYFRNKH